MWMAFWWTGGQKTGVTGTHLLKRILDSLLTHFMNSGLMEHLRLR